MPFALLMVVAMMLWGGGWPALKILTTDVSWEVATFWRFALMTLAFIPVLAWYRVPMRLSLRALGWVSLSAFLNAAFMGLSFWGVAVGTAGAGGVVITTLSPILTVLVSLLFFGLKPSRRHVAGLFIGLLGGAIMVDVWDWEILSHGGNLIFVLCALVWAVLTLSAQRSHLHLDPIHYTFLLGLVATLGMAVVAYPHGIGSAFDQGWEFWGAAAYLAVLGQTVASTIYFVASGKMGSNRASAFMFLVPVCALIASYLMLDEIPSSELLVGGAISIAAVYLINRRGD